MRMISRLFRMFSGGAGRTTRTGGMGRGGVGTATRRRGGVGSLIRRFLR